MGDQRWQRINQIFQQAVTLPPEQRPAYLDQACQDDPELRAEVDAILGADANLTTDEFLHPRSVNVKARLPSELGESGSAPWRRTASQASQESVLTGPNPNLRRRLAAASMAGIQVGATIGDFELQAVLGRGAFGTVYLARENSLDRTVALKLTPNFGTEARTMASLEHPNIVQVFSESVDTKRGLRLLCMQLVAGADLQSLITELKGVVRHGSAVLDAVGRLSPMETTLRVEDLQERQAVAETDSVEFACRLGGLVARALAHAHQKGVLHRDIKPANILVSQYGRPLLADFGIAASSSSEQDQPLGGTLAYMSPEHLAAFDPTREASAEMMDRQSDIYSLGVVLFQWLTGELPFASGSSGSLADMDTLTELAGLRERPAKALRPRLANAPAPLAHLVLRCLEPDKTQRYQSAEELALACEACRWLQTAKRQLPHAGRLTQFLIGKPFSSAVTLAFLPHLAAGVACPVYAILVLSHRMTGSETSNLGNLATAYFILFPLMGAAVYWRFAGVFRALSGVRELEPETADIARRRMVTAPWTAVLMGCAPWLLLLLLVPAVFAQWGRPLQAVEWMHLGSLVGYGLAIATSYSYLILQYAVVRAWYMQLWVEPVGGQQAAARELSGVQFGSRLFVMLASLVPLAAAISLILVGPQAVGPDGYTLFRIVGVSLILLGAAGVLFSLRILRLILQSLEAWLPDRARAS